VIDVLRAELEDRCPEPLAIVREREEEQRDEVRALLEGEDD
jgi:hypothetical protein